MQKPIYPVLIGIIRNNGKYLLTRRAEKDPEDSQFHGVWQIPGGGLEWGEHVENALRREMREELGVEVNIIGLLPKIFENVRGKRWHGIFLCYLCKMQTEDSLINLNEEASEYGWFTPEEAKKLNSFPETAEMIDLAASIP